MTFLTNRELFDRKLAQRTLHTGRIYAGLVTLLLIPMIFTDKAVFGMFNTLPSRLIGIFSSFIFFAGSYTFLKHKKRLIIPLYGLVILGSIIMFCWLGFIVFTQFPTNFHVSSFLLGLVMLMFISTWMSLGVQRYLPIMIFGMLVFLNILLLAIVPSVENMGSIFAINTIGIFTMAFNYYHDKNDFELFKAQQILIQKEKELSLQKEKLENANKDLQSFNYSISHDLRTPVRNVNSFVQLLLKKVEDHEDREIHEYAGYIQNGIQQMVELIEGLGMLSKIGKKRIRKQYVDLESLAREKLKELMVNYDPELPTPVMNVHCHSPVYGSKILIGQVLTNLLSNAIKYSLSSTIPEITISQTKEDGFHIIEVKDNGIGFDEKFAESLFIPFKRLHSSAIYQGVGLGLSIVERIIRLHGGKVWAKPGKENGASFFFSLPTLGEEKIQVTGPVGLKSKQPEFIQGASQPNP